MCLVVADGAADRVELTFHAGEPHEAHGEADIGVSLPDLEELGRRRGRGSERRNGDPGQQQDGGETARRRHGRLLVGRVANEESTLARRGITPGYRAANSDRRGTGRSQSGRSRRDRYRVAVGSLSRCVAKKRVTSTVLLMRFAVFLQPWPS